MRRNEAVNIAGLVGLIGCWLFAAAVPTVLMILAGIWLWRHM